MNRRAHATLERLVRRYESARRIPVYDEVESALWRASRQSSARLGGYWPRKKGTPKYADIEKWTSRRFGWSFPCSEVIGLVQRYFHCSSGRVIDVGAGQGLWTKVLRRALGPERVIGLDPDARSEWVLPVSFEKWCSETGGPRDGDVLLTSWLPCKGQPGSDLGVRILYSIRTDQTLIYIGSGPRGGTGTQGFYDRLGREFDEFAAEPIPRLYPNIRPRDFARAYSRKRSSATYAADESVDSVLSGS